MRKTGKIAAPTGKKPPAWARRLASLRLTLVVIGLFFLSVAAMRWTTLAPTWLLALPLALFAVNLATALWVHGRLRRNWPMFVFHLSLFCLLVLAAVGRLSYLKGITEVTEGGRFSGQLHEVEQGPFHLGDLDQVDFRNLELRVHYHAGPRRAETLNKVQWQDSEGVHTAVIGDQYPVMVEGYRIYTSRNFGFAPVFTWLPQHGPARSGSVHLNQYPHARLNQVQEWTPPGSRTKLWLKLDFEDNLLSADKPSVLRPPEQHELVIRHGEFRTALVPGQTLALAEGTLRYEGLRMWMGYRFHYDWTIPWMLAISLVAVASLIAHFVISSRTRPWQRNPITASTPA